MRSRGDYQSTNSRGQSLTLAPINSSDVGGIKVNLSNKLGRNHAHPMSMSPKGNDTPFTLAENQDSDHYQVGHTRNMQPLSMSVEKVHGRGGNSQTLDNVEVRGFMSKNNNTAAKV